MKKLFFVLIFSVFFGYVLNAQTNLTDQQKLKIKPVFIIEDLAFAYNLLNTVEINGSEAETFIACRATIADAVKMAQSANKKQGDEVQVEIEIPMAQNILNLAARAKLTGSQAEQYKRFVDSITNAAKALRQQSEKK